MFSYHVRIPRERIAVLIGTDGETKEKLEEETNSSIDVDSKEGEVTITGEDAVKLFSAQNIVKAIARGFNPDIALNLLKTDWVFELIDLNNYNTKKNHQQRLKGRVIGQGGKARKIIEDFSGAHISVYGKTVGIVAPAEGMHLAKYAVESLLEGANHSTVYRTLERKQRDMRVGQLMGADKP